MQIKFTRLISYKFKLPRETPKNKRIMLNEILLYNMTNVPVVTTFKNELDAFLPVYNTRYAPIFYWSNSCTNIELNATKTRLQRQHNEIFGTLQRSNPSISNYKAKINLPAKNWN